MKIVVIFIFLVFSSQAKDYTQNKEVQTFIRMLVKEYTMKKNKQRSTKDTHKTKGQVPRISLKAGCALRCFGRVSSSCSTSNTRRVNLVTNPVISHERRKDREVLTTSETYPWSFVTQISHSGQPSRRSHQCYILTMFLTQVSLQMLHPRF